VTADTVTPLFFLCCACEPFTVYFFSIRCGAEHGYFGIAVFTVIITGMNDGARWHKLYARGDPFQADDDGSVQHPPPKAVLWRSSRSSRIAIRHPRRCYVLGRGRRTLQSALCSSCSTCMRCYCIIGARSDEQRKCQCIFFLVAFLDLPVPKMNAEMAPSYHHHHKQASSLRSPYGLHTLAFLDLL
jgi:hypothetical protein